MCQFPHPPDLLMWGSRFQVKAASNPRAADPQAEASPPASISLPKRPAAERTAEAHTECHNLPFRCTKLIVGDCAGDQASRGISISGHHVRFSALCVALSSWRRQPASCSCRLAVVHVGTALRSSWYSLAVCF